MFKLMLSDGQWKNLHVSRTADDRFRSHQPKLAEGGATDKGKSELITQRLMVGHGTKESAPRVLVAIADTAIEMEALRVALSGLQQEMEDLCRGATDTERVVARRRIENACRSADLLVAHIDGSAREKSPWRSIAAIAVAALVVGVGGVVVPIFLPNTPVRQDLDFFRPAASTEARTAGDEDRKAVLELRAQVARLAEENTRLSTGLASLRSDSSSRSANERVQPARFSSPTNPGASDSAVLGQMDVGVDLNYVNRFAADMTFQAPKGAGALELETESAPFRIDEFHDRSLDLLVTVRDRSGRFVETRPVSFKVMPLDGAPTLARLVGTNLRFDNLSRAEGPLYVTLRHDAINRAGARTLLSTFFVRALTGTR